MSGRALKPIQLPVRRLVGDSPWW